MTVTVAMAPALADAVVRMHFGAAAPAPRASTSARELCGGVRCGSGYAVRGRAAGGDGGPRRVTVAATKKKVSGETKGFPWFKFGKNGMDSEGAGIYGSQKREDFDRDDVEQYFNYMGMLATEGTYDKMEALLNTGIQAVDILLLLAASEGDKPKIEELIQAGADYRIKDDQGRTALDRAEDQEIKDLILDLSNTQV